MKQEGLFRLIFIAIFVASIIITGYFRHKARRSGEMIPRTREGRPILVLRALFAAPIYLAFLAYAINPEWMGWSSVSLPAWLRGLGVAAGAGMLPVLYWVVSTLGNNISETFLTKRDHRLVRQGPYRLVRHPLYSVGTVIFVSLGVVAANWFIIVMAILIIIGIALVIVPEEEANLIRKFGAEYREYMKQTGMLVPPVDLPREKSRPH